MSENGVDDSVWCLDCAEKKSVVYWHNGDKLCEQCLDEAVQHVTGQPVMRTPNEQILSGGGGMSMERCVSGDHDWGIEDESRRRARYSSLANVRNMRLPEKGTFQ